MKHSHHCHCGFSEKYQKLRAGKLGVLGGLFIVLHLLYHVAECLILPAIFIAAHSNSVEAVEELAPDEAQATTLTGHFDELETLQIKFYDSLREYALHP